MFSGCPLPCQVGEFCRSGAPNGGKPFSVCARDKWGATYWKLLHIRPDPSYPICPVDSGGQCESAGNSCYVRGIDGRYRCTKINRATPLEPAGMGWLYEEHIPKPPFIGIFESLEKDNCRPRTRTAGKTSKSAKRVKSGKFERCVKAVKAKQPKHCAAAKYNSPGCYNPYAVCTASVKRNRQKSQPSSNRKKSQPSSNRKKSRS
jgi:hypothetical protein